MKRLFLFKQIINKFLQWFILNRFKVFISFKISYYN